MLKLFCSCVKILFVPVTDLFSLCSYRDDSIDGLVDPAFMSMTRDPDQRRKEQWEKAAQAQAGWAWGRWLGLGGLGAPALSSTEQDSLHGRFLARANAVNLTEVAEMKILYLLFSTFFFIIQKFWLFETKNGHIIVR
jgi:hypothetical protein